MGALEMPVPVPHPNMLGLMYSIALCPPCISLCGGGGLEEVWGLTKPRLSEDRLQGVEE